MPSLVDSKINELKRPFSPSRSTLNLAFSSALELPARSYIIKYLDDDLQCIFKTILEDKISTIVLLVFF